MPSVTHSVCYFFVSRSRYIRRRHIFVLFGIALFAFLWNALLLADDPVRYLPSTQADIDYIGEFLQIKYEPKGNNCCSGDERPVHRIRLSNIGSQLITGGDWEIFFSQVASFDAQSVGSPLVLRHINGFLYGLRFQDGVKLEAGSHIILRIPVLDMINRYYAFPRWYVASSNLDLRPRILRSTVTEDMEFVEHSEFSNRSSIYDANDVVDLQMAPNLILPTPLAVELGEPTEQILLDSTWTVVYQNGLTFEASLIADALQLRMINDSEQVVKSSAQFSVIYLRIGIVKHFATYLHSRVHLSEGYEISVSNNSVIVCGQTAKGVFYGVQSLLSLLASSVNGRSLPRINVLDAPRLQYRGLMLDVARNFIEKNAVLKTLDVMAMYKMNKLHLHLTDDQGWRLEIPGLPELTDIGSKRGHDPSGSRCLMSSLASGPEINDADNHGTGFYSKSDYRQILLHAKQRHIDIIPEIDMPGHSYAAIHSMRVRSAKSDGSEKYLLSDPNDTSVYLGISGAKDSVMNPCLGSTFAFIQHIMKALIDMHKDIQPLTVFHLGGDEVPIKALTQSPACQQLLEETREYGFKAFILSKLNRLGSLFGKAFFEDYEQPSNRGLKRYFISHVSRMATDLGLSIQTWEDGLATRSQLPPDIRTWQTDEVFVNTFNFHMTTNVLTLANAGYKVILSYASHFYLDHPQESDFDERGLAWATKYVGIETIFKSVVPFEQLRRGEYMQKLVCDTYQLGFCDELHKPGNIIGLQASLWTELVRTTEQLEYMLYPRLLAVAERAWHEAEWQSAANKQQLEEGSSKDWYSFINTVGYKELQRLENIGIRYRLPTPGVKFVDEHTVLVNSQFPGLNLVSSVDGGKTWKDHPAGASHIISDMLIATRTFNGRRRSRVIRI